MITQIQGLVTSLLVCRSPQVLTPQPLAHVGTELSTSWAKRFIRENSSIRVDLVLVSSQELGSTLPAQPFGHRSLHTRGAQAECHHQIASEKTGSVAFEKPLKSSFSII